MKTHLILFLLLTTFSFAQKKDTIQGDKLSEKKIEKIFAKNSSSVILKSAVFPGCEKKRNKKKCFQEKLHAVVTDNFNRDIGFGTTEKKYVKITSKIKFNKSGKLEILNIDAPTEDLKIETRRTLMLIPVIQPPFTLYSDKTQEASELELTYPIILLVK